MLTHLCVLAALLLLIACVRNVSAYHAAVVVGEVTQRDTSRPVYSLRLPQLGETAQAGLTDGSSSSSARVRMVTARGQVLHCNVPSPRPMAERGQVVEHAFDDVDGLLQDYQRKCFIREEGWWRFEFCYGRDVVQRHVPAKKDEREEKFVLGRFDKEVDKERRKNVSQVSMPGALFTQEYVNGTLCDVTNKPRRVIIKYICFDDAAQMSTIGKMAGRVSIIRAIREVETCVYELEFISDAICQQKLYKNSPQRSALEIKCNMEEGQAPFEGLVSKSYRKASIQL